MADNETHTNSLVGRAITVINDAKHAGRLSEGEIMILADLVEHPSLPSWTRNALVMVIPPDPPALHDE